MDLQLLRLFQNILHCIILPAERSSNVEQNITLILGNTDLFIEAALSLRGRCLRSVKCY